MELSEIRQEIDVIDRQIVELFKRRMNCSVMVAEQKKKTGSPILNIQRELDVLEKVENLGGEFGHYTRLLYGNVMELSRDIQYTIINGDNELRNIIRNADKEIARSLCNVLLDNCKIEY